jgi:hypothetical protein
MSGAYLCWTLTRHGPPPKTSLFVHFCTLEEEETFIGSPLGASKLLEQRMVLIFRLRLEPARISSVGVCRGGA